MPKRGAGGEVRLAPRPGDEPTRTGYVGDLSRGEATGPGAKPPINRIGDTNGMHMPVELNEAAGKLDPPGNGVIPAPKVSAAQGPIVTVERATDGCRNEPGIDCADASLATARTSQTRPGDCPDGGVYCDDLDEDGRCLVGVGPSAPEIPGGVGGICCDALGSEGECLIVDPVDGSADSPTRWCGMFGPDGTCLRPGAYTPVDTPSSRPANSGAAAPNPFSPSSASAGNMTEAERMRRASEFRTTAGGAYEPVRPAYPGTIEERSSPRISDQIERLKLLQEDNADAAGGAVDEERLREDGGE